MGSLVAPGVPLADEELKGSVLGLESAKRNASDGWARFKDKPVQSPWINRGTWGV